MASKNYDDKDFKLAETGRKRILWAGQDRPVLQRVKERFRKEQPFKGMRFSACLHVTAETANLWIAIVGTLCFLIAFNLLVNLPNNIANPISELTSSIKQIANRNYSQRVHFQNHNEYGDLAKSFNPPFSI